MKLNFKIIFYITLYIEFINYNIKDCLNCYVEK